MRDNSHPLKGIVFESPVRSSFFMPKGFNHNSNQSGFERPFLVKFTRWVGEGMIDGGEGMRRSNASLSGFGQGLTRYN